MKHYAPCNMHCLDFSVLSKEFAQTGFRGIWAQITDKQLPGTYTMTDEQNTNVQHLR